MGLILPGDSRPGVFYDAELAEKFGVNVAIILGRMIWSIEQHITTNQTTFFKNGRWWMYDPMPALMSYSKLGRKQILLVLTVLRVNEIVETDQFDKKYNVRRNWYSVNTATLQGILTGSIEIKIPEKAQKKAPIVPKGDDRPIVPKGDDTLSQKGTIHDAETGLCIVPKGDDLSKSLTEIHPEIHSKSPDEAPSAASVTPLKIKKVTHSQEDLELAQGWLSYALREMKYTKPPKAWNAENFAEEIAKVRRSTDIEISRLKDVLKFVETDDFWKPNAMSPAGLLKKSKNGMRKIDNILSAMNGGSRNYGTSQSVDYSANPERYKRFSDDKPW